jgi:hypothetical protein
METGKSANRGADGMKPFLRATDRARLAPVGWTSEPAGQWAGRQVEVVYDPRQHQVVMVPQRPGDTTRAELAGAGYRRCASTATQEMWVRDRAAEAAAAGTGDRSSTRGPPGGGNRRPRAVTRTAPLGAAEIVAVALWQRSERSPHSVRTALAVRPRAPSHRRRHIGKGGDSR